MKAEYTAYTVKRDFYIAVGRYPDYTLFPFRIGDLIAIEDDGRLHKIIHGRLELAFSPVILARSEYVNGFRNPRGFECGYVTDSTLLLQKFFPSQNLTPSQFRVLSFYKQNAIIIVPNADNASKTTIILAEPA